MMKPSLPYLILALLTGFDNGVAAQTAVPRSIQPPSTSQLIMQTQARGEQIYQCMRLSGQYQWQLKAPDAMLFDAQERQIGRHYAGPVWEYRDGSRITGKVLEKLDAPQPSAIPWLLLETVRQQGAGLFAGIRYINRVDTQGGMPPAKRCDGNHLGDEKRVPYRAKYYFYTP